MPLQSLLRAFWKRYRLWLLGGLVCGWILFVSAAWWLMDEAGHTIKGVQELLHRSDLLFGVTLAMRDDIFAADCILDAFQRRDCSAASLKPYEERMRVPMHRSCHMIHDWSALLDHEDSRNLILRARQAPWLRERLIVLLAGGYEKMDVESFLLATSPPAM